MTVSPSSRSPTVVQLALLWVAGAFIALGLFGFIPGITTGVGSLDWAGSGSEAYIFGLFQVSILHNVIHLGTGLVAFLCTADRRAARIFLAVAGVLYLLLAVYGWLLDQAAASNPLPVNDAGDWLHFVLAAVMATLAIGAPGLSFSERRAQREIR